MRYDLPQPVLFIIQTLEHFGYETFIVGGCVRDVLMGVEPHDWDITTNALPTQIISCFPTCKIIETGLKHGTVTLVIEGCQYEITTYRIDGVYSDNRHPNKVGFTPKLTDDLSRRDFTMNAMAYNYSSGLIDIYNGRKDIQNYLIKCVGDPDKRFQEDALRIMRALRFASKLNFKIEKETSNSIFNNKQLLLNISEERLNAELCKTLLGDGVEGVLRQYKDILSVFIPEIKPMFGFEQHNIHHCYDVWEHTIKAISASSKDIIIRLTLLFHDIAKPQCFTLDENGSGHFYTHPEVGSKITKDILRRLKFDNNTIEDVGELICFHDSIGRTQDKAIRRMLRSVGEKRFKQLIEVKRADIIAQAPVQREERLDRLNKIKKEMGDILEKQQCFSLSKLAVNGTDLLKLGIPEGREIGKVLSSLMDFVIENPDKNNHDELLSLVSQRRI